MYQKLHNKAKCLIGEDSCPELYNVKKTLYLETDASEVGIGADA